MMFSTRRAVVCVLVLAGVAVCGHAQSTSVQEQTASISGKVTVAGEGVKGVVIALRTKESPSYGQLTSHRGVTDDKGQYRITNVPAGNYLVTPTATMFVADDDTNGERALMVDKGQTIEDFDFSLVRGGVITGRVLDSEGQPLIEEDVYLFSPRDPRLGSFRPAAVTDDRGVYRAFGLKPGNYTVAAGRNDIMGPTGHREHGPAYVRTFYPGVTDQAQAATIKVSDGSETTNIDITLGRPLTPHSASGRVVDSQTGQPVPDANYGVIQFVSGTQRMSVNRGSLTNSRGEFKLENLTPGQYAVTVQPRDGGDWRAEELRFEIADQDVSGLVVRTVKGGSVSGVVVLDGTYDNSIREQLANARLVVFVETEATRRSGTPGVASALRPDGSFHIGGLPTGKVTFMLSVSPRFRIVRIERDGVILPGSVEVKQGEDVTALRVVVGYGDAVIRGAVVIDNGAIPPRGELFVWLRRVADNSSVLRAAQLDARGQFVFDNLSAGPYELIAGVLVRGARAPLVQTKQEVTATPGATSNITIKLDLNSPKP